jgi:multiple sugar transport system permease protein
MNNRMKDNLEGMLFISPWLIGFVLFVVGPMGFSIGISFFEWDIISTPNFLGFDNYGQLLRDPLFWKSLKITVIYTICSAPARVTIAFILAFLLNQAIAGKAFFRAIFYMPVMVSGVSLALFWAWVLNSDYGLLNEALQVLGIQGPRWLGNGSWAMVSVIMMSLWRVGGMMVIFLAGLQDIPVSLYESAVLAGASSRQKLTYITLPMITPALFYNLVMSLIQSFQVFGEVEVLTSGGPYDSTLVYMINVYRESFRFLRMGYGAALSWVMFFIILVVTLTLFRSSNRWVFYAGAKGGT